MSQRTIIPIHPSEPMTLEVSVDELHVLKHLRSELHDGALCRVCRDQKYWYNRYNEARAEGYQAAIKKVAEG